MDIDESIQVQNRANNGYNQCYKNYQMITIFDSRYTFYEIERLDSDLLVGYNLLKKIGAVIDIARGVIQYNGK